MYPASENFAVLRSELDSMEGMMWTSFAGCRTLCTSSLTVAAAVLVGYAPGGDEGSSRGANAGRCSAVRHDGGYGVFEHSLFDDLFKGGDVVDIIDGFLHFDLAWWRGCVIKNRIVI